MDLDQKYADTEKNPKGDLVTGIDKCIQVLKDEKCSEEDKVFYLKNVSSFGRRFTSTITYRTKRR